MRGRIKEGVSAFFPSSAVIFLSSFVVAFSCAFTCAPAAAHFPIPPKKGEIGRRVVDKPVKNFTLIDQTGKKFQLADARGKVVGLTFVYTRCPDVCPLFTAKFASLQRDLTAKEQQRKTQTDYLLLTITTDPEYDTPAQLKSYAELFKPDFSKWSFLTGDKDALAKVWKDFGVSVRKISGGQQIQHTALTTLIDRDGKRRVDYYGEKWHEKQFLQDLVSLAARNQPAD
jgi:protein SCO1/2